jgi:hypothetical protein
MSGDGADLGLNAAEALEVVVGGAEAPPGRSTQEMAAIIRATDHPVGYEGTANYCAKLILQWLEADPTRAQGPVENVYREGPDGQKIYKPPYAEVGWYEKMKQDGIPLDQLDLTGFMWGWAVNAARCIVELPPVPNPAIVVIGSAE